MKRWIITNQIIWLKFLKKNCFGRRWNIFVKHWIFFSVEGEEIDGLLLNRTNEDTLFSIKNKEDDVYKREIHNKINDCH